MFQNDGFQHDSPQGPRCPGISPLAASLCSLLNWPRPRARLPHVAALMAQAQVTLTLAIPAKRANLTLDDLVKCLLMALFDQTWGHCPLLEPYATVWGERRGGVAPQRKMGVLFPKPGVWMLGRENRDHLLRCPVLGVGAAQGQHPTHKPPGAPRFPTPTYFFLDILFRHSFSLRPLMICPGVREWEFKTRRQALGQGAAGGPQGLLSASSPPPTPQDGSPSAVSPFLLSLAFLLFRPPACHPQIPLGHAQYRSRESMHESNM